MRAKAAVLQAQSLLASEFAALAESQAKAYRSLESGVDQVHTDFRTVTAVPTEYWKLRRSLDSVTGPEREKVLSEIHSLENDALGAAGSLTIYSCEIFLVIFIMFGIRNSVLLTSKVESPVKARR